MSSDPETLPIFTALASVIIAIENGSIEEAEVDWNRTNPDESAETITITVRKTVQPRFGNLDTPPQEEK